MIGSYSNLPLFSLFSIKPYLSVSPLSPPSPTYHHYSSPNSPTLLLSYFPLPSSLSSSHYSVTIRKSIGDQSSSDLKSTNSYISLISFLFQSYPILSHPDLLLLPFFINLHSSLLIYFLWRILVRSILSAPSFLPTPTIQLLNTRKNQEKERERVSERERAPESESESEERNIRNTPGT